MIKKKTGSQYKKQEADLPIYPPMQERMNVDFLFNEKGGVWLLHDKPLPENLGWVEYDGDLEKVTLVSSSGKIQDMGLDVPAGFGHHLHGAMEITTLLVQEGDVTDFAIVPIITRQIVN